MKKQVIAMARYVTRCLKVSIKKHRIYQTVPFMLVVTGKTSDVDNKKGRIHFEAQVQLNNREHNPPTWVKCISHCLL